MAYFRTGGGTISGIATQVELDAVETDADKTQTNLAVLAFKQAVNNDLVKYSLKDQIIDEFETAAGIDTSASTGENYTTGVSYSGLQGLNYFGDDSDGTVTTSGSVTHTVQNKVGSYDGDMLVKNYINLTVASGHTMTVDQPCRGMLIYCSGNCTIAGTLTMQSKGAFADPTSGTGGSDNNAVQAAGLQIGFRTASGTVSQTNAVTNFNGCGTAARTSIGNFADTVGNGTTITVPRTGAAGGNGHDGSPNAAGIAGAHGSSGQTGGGGSGAGYMDAGATENSRLGDGSYGSCFVGGSGGGSAGGSGQRSQSHMDQTHAAAWGGAGGIGTGSASHGGFAIQGGAGSLTGNGFCAGGPCSASDYHATGEAGNGGGGLIILIVKGNLTVTGTISAQGGTPNGLTGTVNAITGGSSGGGSIVYAYAGTLSNSGTITAGGGPGTNGETVYDPGAGGNGSIQPLAVLSSTVGDQTLQSLDTAAETEPDFADMVMLIEDAGGTPAVINTDIKGFISEDSGLTFTEGTLVDEGDWGTNKRILAFHDLDISAQSGTAMCYKITTHNQTTSKETKIHATSIGWR